MAENLTHLLATSLGFGALIALLLFLRRRLEGRFAPTWWRQVWTWLMVVMFLYLSARSFLAVWVPSLVDVATPQAVLEGAYDRVNGYSRDHERIVEAGSGGAGGAMATIDGENIWFRHHVHYEDAAGRDVLIRDNDYLRTVTINGATTYTVHWTGMAYLVYWLTAAALFFGGLVRYGLFRRRALRQSIPVGEEDLAALAEQRRVVGCDRPLELYRCTLVHTPLLMGFLHPVILLPQGQTGGSLGTALAHELTHLKHRDTGYLLLISLARSLHWFNPLVWLMARRAQQDVELCCDYELLKARDEAGRRAYGRTLLDQMTAGEHGLSRLTTGFSGDKGEVFARFRAIMDSSPKRRGRAAMAAAMAAAVLAGSLVGCQAEADRPEGDGAWITALDPEAGTVAYVPLTREQLSDPDALWDEVFSGDLLSRERTAELAEGASLLHTWEGEAYSLNPVTIQHTVGMSQAGIPGEVVLDGAGRAVRVQLSDSAHLALDGAGLDFTGWCGRIELPGPGAALLSSIPVEPGSIFFYDGGDSVTIDPQSRQGADSDHTQYTLPVSAEAAQAWAELENADWTYGYTLTVVDGTVTQIEARPSPGAYLPLSPSDALKAMSDLQGGDIADISFSGGPVTVGWAEGLDRDKLARMICQAAGQPQVPKAGTHSDEGFLDYGLWTLNLYLKDGSVLSLYAGRAEDQVSISETVHLEECPELYRLIRSASDSAQRIADADPAILDVMDQVLADTLALWNTPDYGGGYGASYLDAQLTALSPLEPPEALGDGVELYSYDLGFVADDLFNAPWADSSWVDSQLRYHTGPNAYLVAERGGDGSVLRWGTFLHKCSPPFGSWDEEMRSAFSTSAAHALERGGVE